MSPKRQFVPAHTKTRRARVVLIVLGIAIIFLVPVLRNSVRRSAAVAGAGISTGTHSVGSFLWSIGTGFRLKNTLVKQNEGLVAENAALKAELASTETLTRENEELKAAAGRMESSEFILAAVIDKPPHSVYDTMVIDGGAQAGMVKSQTVYANGYTPIGVITEVMPRTALVRLYSAPGEKTEARLSPSNADVTIIGRGGGNYSVDVAHELAIEAGTTIVTKEINPRVLGIFKKITSDPRDPFQTLLLASPVNINSLAFVQVRK